MRSLDNHSDDSETSSVCSERSFDSYRRASDVSLGCLMCCWVQDTFKVCFNMPPDTDSYGHGTQFSRVLSDYELNLEKKSFCY